LVRIHHAGITLSAGHRLDSIVDRHIDNQIIFVISSFARFVIYAAYPRDAVRDLLHSNCRPHRQNSIDSEVRLLNLFPYQVVLNNHCGNSKKKKQIHASNVLPCTTILENVYMEDHGACLGAKKYKFNH